MSLSLQLTIEAMSEFSGRDTYRSDPQSSYTNSGTVSGLGLVSPPAATNLAKQQSLNIPNKVDKPDTDNFLLRSLDIKKQLSLSFQGPALHGGIYKQKPRKLAHAVRSDASDDDDNEADKYSKLRDDGDGDGDDQGHERKRRDNINDKIQELLSLVPAEFFQEAAAPATATSATSENAATDQLEHDAAIAAAMKNSGTKDGKPNKGQILTKSVEYIQYLQKVIDENNRKEVELTMKLKSLEMKRDNAQLNVPINIGHTSAEVALGEIGVGPLSDGYFKQVLQNSAKRSTQSP